MPCQKVIRVRSQDGQENIMHEVPLQQQSFQNERFISTLNRYDKRMKRRQGRPIHLDSPLDPIEEYKKNMAVISKSALIETS